MPETVTLPSRLELELEPPKVRRLLDLASHGPLNADMLANVCLEGCEDSAYDLCEDDAFFVACWALERLGADEDGVGLAALCESFSVAPSVRLRIADPVLAYECDLNLLSALREAQKEN
jgi:hypothetical protein